MNLLLAQRKNQEKNIIRQRLSISHLMDKTLHLVQYMEYS